MWTAHAYRVLPATLNTVVVLYLLLSLSHVFVVAPDIRTPLVTGATLTAVFAAGVRLFVDHPLIKRFSETILLTLVVLGAANSLLHILLSADIQQSTNLIFVIAACGFLVTNTRHFVAISLGILLIWAAIAIILANTASLHFAYALVVSCFMAALLHHLTRLYIQQHDTIEHAAQSLVGNEHRAELILKSVGYGIIGTDAKGLITVCNQAGARLAGRTVSGMIGQTVNDMLTPPILNKQNGQFRGTLNLPEGERLDILFEVSDLQPDIEAPTGGRVIVFQALHS